MMSTYRIAICEDDTPVGKDLAVRCRTIFEAWHVDVDVSLFASADALQAFLKAGSVDFDLFLMDIEMQGMDGLTLAQWLYDNGARNKVIFITGHAEYALAGYRAHPLNYLLKPVDDRSLEESLQLAWSLHGPQTLVLKRGRNTYSLPLANIRYLESQGHNTRIYFVNESRLFNFPSSSSKNGSRSKISSAAIKAILSTSPGWMRSYATACACETAMRCRSAERSIWPSSRLLFPI